MAQAGEGILTRERVLVYVLLACTAIVLYLCFLIIKPFLPAVAWATALAVVGYPIHRRLAARVKRPGLAAGISVVLVAIILIVPALIVMQQVTDQTIGNYEHLKAAIDSDRWKAAIESHPRLAPMLRWVERNINLQEEIKQVGERIAANAARYVGGSVWVITQWLVTMFVLFYFFRDRNDALNAVRGLLPLSNAEATEVFTRVADTIHATIFGNVVVALVQGALGGLMFWLLGLPGPLLWGLVMGLLAIIPFLGAFVIWVPAAIYLVLQGEVVKALILTGWGTLVVGTIDNILYPILVGSRLRLHTLPVFFAIVGGLVVFGAAGMVLGPVIFALAVALIDIWRIRTAAGRPAEEALKRSEQLQGPIASESQLILE
jgi:predicted PurR-regulated permease PerM